MASRPLNAVPRTSTKMFYVYDPAIADLGGIKVVPHPEEDKQRIVNLTSRQAQYFIDQGVIGTETPANMSNEGKKLVSQFTNGRNEPKTETKADDQQQAE